MKLSVFSLPAYATSIAKTHFHSKHHIFCNVKWNLDKQCLQTKFPELLYPNVPTAGKMKEKRNLKIKTVIL